MHLHLTCHHWPHWAKHITAQLHRIEETMTEISADQAHLSDDVAALGTAIATAVNELKAQIAAGQPAAALDFTGLDTLVASTQAEAAADAPPAPPVA